MNIWMKELLKNLDNNLDENKRKEIMEACGENCPFTHLTDERLLNIKKKSKNEVDLIERLSKNWRVRIEENNVYVVFDKCYCPLINEDIRGASSTLCFCTLGNIKKKFRLALDREVNVIMERTILSGDSECRFKVLV